MGKIVEFCYGLVQRKMKFKFFAFERDGDQSLPFTIS